MGPDGAGGFVVTWDSYGSSGTDSASQSVQGQRYASDGSPAGSEFQVNTYTTGRQLDPAVGPDGFGGFVVTWRSEGSDGTDSSFFSVQGRRYASDGSPTGSEFQVNTYTLDNQGRPAVAPDGAGGFVVSWQSDDGNGDDTDGPRIQAQRYFGPNIFEDGFESGDTSAWSSVVP